MASTLGANRCRIGIDVGGTFTDFVLANMTTGELTRYKEPSVPADPSMSVRRGLPPLIEQAGIATDDIELIVHGTTLLVNAIIQRRGAKVALVVTKGHRGILEIGRMSLENSYDFTLRKEEPLITRNLIFETTARHLVDGSVIATPDDAEYDALAKSLKDQGVDAVTVLLLNSYAHPEMEASVAAALRERLPGIPVSASARIWPERREFERALVTIINAYVQPLMEDYLRLLVERIGEVGITAPIYITASNGGTLSIETARGRPIDTVLSGPASGVVAATEAAKAAKRDHLITVDMGGTSCDLALTRDGEPEYATVTKVGDFPLVVPVVNVISIGAGGGSIIWVDAQGILKVGPHSAGADPGPVCYGHGGAEPTITDCYLLVGYIHPDHFLGGRMKLDENAARLALEAIADKVGIEGDDKAVKAADAALRVATAMMSTELYKGLARRGEDPREYALMAFGGAGPTHGNLLAQEARLDGMIVPPAPATFCAMGAILADVKRDYVRSSHLRFTDGKAALADLARIFREIEEEASEWIAKEGDLLGEPEFAATLDMRYAGQAYDLGVAIPDELRLNPEAEGILELFHREHERIYSFRDLESGVEATTQRIRVIGRIPPVTIPDVETGTLAKAGDIRRVFNQGKYLDVPVYLRREMGRGQKVTGPAILEQRDSTVWILPDWKAEIDRIGNILITAPNGKK